MFKNCDIYVHVITVILQFLGRSVGLDCDCKDLERCDIIAAGVGMYVYKSYGSCNMEDASCLGAYSTLVSNIFVERKFRSFAVFFFQKFFEILGFFANRENKYQKTFESQEPRNFIPRKYILRNS